MDTSVSFIKQLMVPQAICVKYSVTIATVLLLVAPIATLMQYSVTVTLATYVQYEMSITTFMQLLKSGASLAYRRTAGRYGEGSKEGRTEGK